MNDEKKKEPTVGIILVNWNGFADTIQCLASLQRCTYKPVHIYVVDNGSQNQEGERIREAFPSVTVIINEMNRGFTGGNNVGIQRALADGVNAVLLLNNDTTVDESFLTQLVTQGLANPSVGVVGAKILYSDSSIIWFAGGYIQYSTGFARHYFKGTPDAEFTRTRPYLVPYVTGCCLLIRREVIERIGLLYEPYFAYFEEVDWCFSAREAGWKSVIVPTSVIWHKKSGSSSTRGTNKLGEVQAFYQARNAFIFAQRKLHGLKKLQFLLAQFTIRLAINLALSATHSVRVTYLRGIIAGIRFRDT